MNKISENQGLKGIITDEKELREAEKISDSISEMLIKLRETDESGSNEGKIRNLCQLILAHTSPLRDIKTEKREVLEAEKLCYEKLNRLERKRILTLPAESFLPFYKCDFPLLVKNAVCASDVLLHSPFLSFQCSPYSPFYTVCSQKLLTRAVCEEALFFHRFFERGTVTFSTGKRASYSVLSAKIIPGNQSSLSFDEKEFSVLRKIAQIHSGRFLVSQNEASFTLYLTVETESTASVPYRRIPSYIDMLSDRAALPYIILGYTE